MLKKNNKHDSGSLYMSCIIYDVERHSTVRPRPHEDDCKRKR